MIGTREAKSIPRTRLWQRVVLASLATLMCLEPGFLWALVRVSNNTLMSAATQTPKPEYPPLAKNQQAQGQVEVDVVVGPDGTVKDAHAISGHLLLRDSARATAMKWKFDPEKLHNEQDVIGTLVFNFKLS
jgi:TonB family protein